MSTQARRIDIQSAAAKQLIADLVAAGIDDEESVTLSIESETTLVEAVQSAVDRIAELDAMSEAIKLRSDNFSERLLRFANQRATIKRAIALALDAAQQKKIETPIATVYVSNGRQRGVVTDPTALTDEYLVPQPAKPNMTLITKALNDGVEVPGAALSAPSIILNIRTR